MGGGGSKWWRRHMYKYLNIVFHIFYPSKYILNMLKCRLRVVNYTQPLGDSCVTFINGKGGVSDVELLLRHDFRDR